jgi:hypothetical protein
LKHFYEHAAGPAHLPSVIPTRATTGVRMSKKYAYELKVSGQINGKTFYRTIGYGWKTKSTSISIKLTEKPDTADMVLMETR